MKRENEIMNVDAMMDERFGKVGTPEREAFRKEAYAYCVGHIISDASVRRLPSKNSLNYPQYEGTQGRNRFLYGKSFRRKMISRIVPQS